MSDIKRPHIYIKKAVNDSKVNSQSQTVYYQLPEIPKNEHILKAFDVNIDYRGKKTVFKYLSAGWFYRILDFNKPNGPFGSLHDGIIRIQSDIDSMLDK